MEKSIVIFGPVEAGKSTLAGYVRAKLKLGSDFEKVISGIKKDLGGEYEEKYKFAYLFDTTRDERIKKRKGVGRTKYTKTYTTVIGDYETIIIDTPGHKKWYRERSKGVYYGEIGIFVLELQKLIKHSVLNPTNLNILHEFFGPLFLWYDIKDKKRKPIIAISQMDKGGFSEEEFETATEIIKIICDDETIKPIPISINVEGEYDHNVLGKSEKMHWYRGPTFMDGLNEIFEELSIDEVCEPLFSHVDKTRYVTEFGRVWKVKIFQGTLRIGSLIKIAPIKCGKEIFASGLAKVKSIQVEKNEDIELAKKGSIVTLGIHDLRIGGKKCGKGESIQTSCMVDPNTRLLMGNLLQFKVPLEETEKFNLAESIQILWFGKFVSSKVVHFGDDGVITFELNSKNAPKVSLPLDNNNKFFFDKFILKNDRNEFTSATLEKLGVPRTLTLYLDNVDNKKDYIENYFKNFSYSMLIDRILFNCDGSLINIVHKIKGSDVELIGESKHVFPNTSIEIEELKEM